VTDIASKSALKGQFLLRYQRLALFWHALKGERGRPVELEPEAGLVRVDDGIRALYVPHPNRAPLYRGGINSRLELVAEKYVGTTGFRPREDDVVVDVGAGIGEFTLWCAEAGARVFAFEPDPLAFECLEKNVAGLANVSIHRTALWKERTHLRLHGSSDTTESTLIEEDGRTYPRMTNVEAVTLDSVAELVRAPVVDLLKVDGEGVEPEILAGATRLLRRTRVVAVDVSSTARRANLVGRVEMALNGMNFRSVPNERSDSILALNASMVGPFNNTALGPQYS
jgi:FkbM family methyltransferase